MNWNNPPRGWVAGWEWQAAAGAMAEGPQGPRAAVASLTPHTQSEPGATPEQEKGAENNQHMPVMQLVPLQEGSRQPEQGQHTGQRCPAKDRRAEQPEAGAARAL